MTMQIPDKVNELVPDRANEMQPLPARINEFKLFDPSSNWIKGFGSSHHGHMKRAEEWYVQCVYYGVVSLHQCVEVDPHRRGGVPVLKGTRVTVAEALGELAESCGIGEVADNFDLDSENLKCLLNGLSLLVNRPHLK
jgi:uncharacterized protein (DUF433 family)